MPPPKQSGLVPVIVDAGVAGGLEAKLDRKLTQPPYTTVAHNVRYPTVGSVRKRNGIRFLPQPSSNDVKSLGNTNDELLATDKSFLYAWSPESNAWANRGVAPQTSVGTTAIGSYQLPATFAGASAQVRGLTYDVIDGVGLAAWDTGDTLHSTNISQLGTITLALFDTATGKTLWTTKISQAFRVNSTLYDVLGAGGQTPTIFYEDLGVGYPVIRAFRGQFYLLFLNCFSGNAALAGTGSFPGFFYALQAYRLGTPTALAAAPPSISVGSYTGCTRLDFGGANPATFRGTFQYAAAVSPSIYYDMATNGDSLMVSVVAQAVGLTSPASATANPATGIQAFTATTGGFTTLTRIQASLLPVGYACGPISLSASPANADGTVPSNAIYGLALTRGFMSYRSPGALSVAGMPLQSILYDAPVLEYSQPIAVKVIDNGTTFEAYATDGIAYKRANISSINGAFSNLTSGGIVIDYACNFGLAAISAQNTAPWLQSRIFYAPDGQLVVWVMVQLYSNKNNFTCLVLVPVGSSVTPQRSVYAHAFYYRAGCALRGMQPCNVVNSGVLAYQLTDIPNRIAAITRIDITSRPYPSICKLKQGALITGGDTKYYDSQTVRTMGWLKSPEVPMMLSGPAVLGIDYFKTTAPATMVVHSNSASNGAPVGDYFAYFGTISGDGVIPAIANYRVGSSLDPAWAYSYIFVWVDYDAFGNAIYSSPSDVVYVNGTQNTVSGSVNYDIIGSMVYIGPGNSGTASDSFRQTFTLPYAPYLPTQYRDILSPTRGQCLVYRNSSKAASLYRRIPPLTYVQAGTFVLPAPPRYKYLSNGSVLLMSDSIQSKMPTVTTAEGYYDLSPDDNVSAPQVYVQPITGSPELPNDPPPPSTFAVSTVRRPFVSSAENRNWLYYGKPYFPGRAPEFNASQLLEIDPASGDITGLAVLDQNVIIFKRERIFVLAGDGPDATGTGVFNNTYAVATDTGCLDSGSIVSTEAGVYFRSSRGIQMLDRSLAVSYIGAQVERIVNAATIASACLVPSSNQIRFALLSNDPAVAGTGADNLVLVYDYFLKKWSTYGFLPGYDPRYSLQLIGQAYWRNNWFGLAGNAIFQDAGPNSTNLVNSPLWTDGPNQVAMDVQTGWIPLHGIQGWGRLRRVNVLGDFRDAHSLTLQIAYDYDDTWIHSITYTPTNTAAGSPQNWRVRAPRQVAEAVKFRLTDNGTGEACVITGLQLETSQKRGALNTPIERSL